MSRGELPNGDPQKAKHCGIAGRMANRVTTLLPGATITVKFRETINHAGWYRISFQPNGEVFRTPPASNGPTAGGAASTYPTEDLTGMLDPGGSGSTILKDRILDNGNLVQMMVDVTLPAVECANCTLQVMSMMTNGPTYNIADGGSIYYQCADITLAANAPDAGVQVTADASVESGGDAGTTGFIGTEVTGGCSTGGGAGVPAALALLGFVGLRRRRR